MRGQTHSDLRKHQQTENVKTIKNTTNTVEVILKKMEVETSENTM